MRASPQFFSPYPSLSSGTRRRPIRRTQDTADFFGFIEKNWYSCPPPLESMVNAKFDGVKRCFRSNPEDTYDVVLFGDSHAEHLFPGFAEALADANVLLLLDESPFVTNQNGRSIVDFINRNASIHTVVYSAMWGLRLPELGDGPWRAVLDATVTALNKPGRRLVMMEDVPSFRFRGFDCAFPALLDPSMCDEPQPVDAINYMDQFRDLAQVDNSVEVF